MSGSYSVDVFIIGLLLLLLSLLLLLLFVRIFAFQSIITTFYQELVALVTVLAVNAVFILIVTIITFFGGKSGGFFLW